MEGAERREDLRMRPKKLTYVALRPDFSKLGKIQDISRGGLCFQYMTQEEQSGDSPNFNVDIFISDDGYYLPSVPCKMVYEKKMEKEVSHPIGLETRLCGLQFKKLSNKQTGQLSRYLDTMTNGEV